MVLTDKGEYDVTVALKQFVCHMRETQGLQINQSQAYRHGASVYAELGIANREHPGPNRRDRNCGRYREPSAHG